MMRRFGGPALIKTVAATTKDASGNLVVRWNTVTTTNSSPNGSEVLVGIPSIETPPVPFTRIEVDNASFPSGDIITLDKYTFIEGVHFDGVDGDTDATATAIAAAMDATPGIEASVDGGAPSVVEIVLSGNVFGEYLSTVVNKTSPPNLNANVSGDNEGHFEQQSLMDPISTG